MTIIGNIRHVAQSRKARRCDWCDEMIEVGQPYASWLCKDGDGIAHVAMHQECRAAGEVHLDPVDNYEFTPGSYSRGCGCENGGCVCKVSQ